MISASDKAYKKHAAIPRVKAGDFHRSELAIMGTACAQIQQLANQIIAQLSPQYSIAYVDADHKAEAPAAGTSSAHGAAVQFTDQITTQRLIYQQQFNSFQYKSLFNSQDLVLINGNHFKGLNQIVVIDALKPLHKKLHLLTDVKLILLTDGNDAIPEYLLTDQPGLQSVPVLSIHNIDGIAAFINSFLAAGLPMINGLVLAGGKSTRMQTDKGSLRYFEKSQRLHTYEMLDSLCANTYISYADEQAVNRQEHLPYITDKFLGLGPMGGILSAFQQAPDAAWLTVACDLPYLSAGTLAYLVHHRNPSKLATAFSDAEGKFPEPLVTLWEPRAYPVLLQFLSQGYSCPRKALINSAIELLQAPDSQELQNVNHPEERDAAMRILKAAL